LRHDFLLLVDADQAVEHQLRDAQRDRLVAGDRIERGGAPVLAVVEQAAVRSSVVLRRGLQRERKDRPDQEYKLQYRSRFHGSLPQRILTSPALRCSMEYTPCTASWIWRTTANSWLISKKISRPSENFLVR